MAGAAANVSSGHLWRSVLDWRWPQAAMLPPSLTTRCTPCHPVPSILRKLRLRSSCSHQLPWQQAGYPELRERANGCRMPSLIATCLARQRLPVPLARRLRLWSSLPIRLEGSPSISSRTLSPVAISRDCSNWKKRKKRKPERELGKSLSIASPGVLSRDKSVEFLIAPNSANLR